MKCDFLKKKKKFSKAEYFWPSVALEIIFSY